ncbi:ThiF family adenylyltransferase [Rhizobium laguerreae]|uniref:ThiF family adenylyltransferase n=1 Tax=Rhizobium laguerreae TaxID=1076926 RepID=UPI001C905BC3|nr:ThiF family adenylyltransferase [Rhizobium laguerreae]MBY3320630.1 ThiF family adenylyltransferase [Rhizobium laguerreae]MBY3362164.1 ThiF family adenylyltransferase [Rhizobium laguerreae]
MSRTLIARNPDLQRLREEGFNIQITDANFLVVNDVPYVKSDRTIGIGALASNLDLAGDQTVRPQDHTAKFAGEYPCNSQGNPLLILQHQTQEFSLGSGLKAAHSFSRKPPCGYYENYYEKMTAYVALLAKEVAVIDQDATARTRRIVEGDPDTSPHNYLDTASSRAEINEAAAKLAEEAVAIVGVGGTGSYVLDLVAKTVAKKIHLFDADDFLTHNAFRAPGAASIDELRGRPKKVEYLAQIYSKMHRGIVPHPEKLTAENADQLTGVSFVFLCMESGPEKRVIVQQLESLEIPFVDVGMGLYSKRNSIGGILRSVLSLPDQRDEARSRISFASDDAQNEYDRNIQVADLNALNACLAVIAWKKSRGFYFDLGHERFVSYTVGNSLLSKGDIHDKADVHSAGICTKNPESDG